MNLPDFEIIKEVRKGIKIIRAQLRLTFGQAQLTFGQAQLTFGQAQLTFCRLEQTQKICILKEEEEGDTTDHYDIVEKLSLNNISPKVLYHERIADNCDTYIMELFDGTVLELWKNIDSTLQELYTAKIINLIEKMHALDIVHLDLYPMNILYKCIDDDIIFAIIDFETAMYISKINDVTSKEHERFVKDFESESLHDIINSELSRWKNLIVELTNQKRVL